MTSRVSLSEQQWRDVFKIRCRSKCGQMPTIEEAQLCNVALKENRGRYVAMDVDIWNETAPFGAVARKR